MDQPTQPVETPQPTVSNQGMTEDTKTIITILLLVFAFPAGVITMWFLPKWKTWVKGLITALGCLPVILFAIFMIFTMVLAMNSPEMQEEFRKSGARQECMKSCALEESATAKMNCEKVCNMFPGDEVEVVE